MAFASIKGRRAASGSGGSSENGGRPFRGRSLFPAPGLIPPLSAWRENARFLSSQPCALRFAFLCAYARHSALRQLGLQLVSGLRYPLVPTTPTSTAPASTRVPRPLHLNTFTGIELISLRFLVRCLFQSADRCDLLAGKLSPARHWVASCLGQSQTLWAAIGYSCSCLHVGVCGAISCPFA